MPRRPPNVCILPALLADPKFELRDHAQVKELVYDKAARKVKAVRYIDTRSGEEYEQPAGIVILGAYVFNNVLLMLTAGSASLTITRPVKARSAGTTAIRSAAMP